MPPPITRVSLTPAPSDAGMPRTLRTTRASLAGTDAFMAGPSRKVAADMGAFARGRNARRWNGTCQPCAAPASARGHAPGAVDARVAGEVGRDGGGADVLDLGEGGHRVVVEPETAEVVGKVQHPARRQPSDRQPQQLHVRALHVEVAG